MNLSLKFLLLISFLISAILAAEEYNENEKDAYYKWFGMTRGNFDKDQLMSKYKRLALKFHPDKNKDPEAASIFGKLSKAMEVLSDEGKRKRYNAGGVKAVDNDNNSHTYGDPMDIFRKFFENDADVHDFFGGGRRAPKAESLQIELMVGLDDMFMGKTVNFDYSRTKVCSKCDGSGADNPNSIRQCNSCNGRGKLVIQMGGGNIFMERICPHCEGKGKIISRPCSKCKGQRLARESEKIQVEIEAGAAEGQAYSYEGMGNEAPGANPGDLFVILKASPHARYQRDGPNLYTEVNITLKEALLGFERYIQQLDGKSLKISSLEIVQSGAVMVKKGLGMPTTSGRGDLYIKFKVILPIKLDSSEKALIEKALTKTHDRDEL